MNKFNGKLTHKLIILIPLLVTIAAFLWYLYQSSFVQFEEPKALAIAFGLFVFAPFVYFLPIFVVYVAIYIYKNKRNEADVIEKTLLILATLYIISAGILSVYIISNHRNIQTRQVENYVSETEKTEDAKNEKNIFNSKLVNLSFTVPEGSKYSERNVLDGKTVKYTGKKVYFKDENNISLGFNAITTDYTDEGTAVPQDIVEGDLRSVKSFKINYFVDRYSKIKEVYPGMYHVTGFDNIECLASVSSFLIVRPPINSNLKYISFYLGSGKFQDNDQEEFCSPKESAIKKSIDEIVKGGNQDINRNLDKSLEIARTFAVIDGQEPDLSSWKTYKSNKYGFSVKYPEECEVLENDKIASDSAIGSIDCHEREYFSKGYFPENAKYSGYVILYYSSKNPSQRLMDLRRACMDIGTSKEKSQELIQQSKINNYDAILNLKGCGLTVGEPSQVFVYNNGKEIGMMGNIHSDVKVRQENNEAKVEGGRDITEEIHNSLFFEK